MTTLTSLLAPGTNAAVSSDMTLEAGETATLSVSGESGTIFVQTKTVEGYSTQGSIGVMNRNGCQLSGPVTFRVFRNESPVAVGCTVESA